MAWEIERPGGDTEASDCLPRRPGSSNYEAPPTRQPSRPWQHRLRGWMPEAIGATLAILTVGIGPHLGHVLDEAATQARAFGPPGYVQQGWLDIEVSENVNQPTGPVVRAVASNGASAGVLHKGDVILSVDGNRVTNLIDLGSEIGTRPAGTVVRLSLERGPSTVYVNVRLGDDPPEFP